MVSPNSPERRLDVWSLRCLFNLAGLYDRWLKGEFADEPPKKRAVRPGSPNAPPNSSFSVIAYYIDQTDGHQLAEVHFFELSDGSSTEHDPKNLHLDGIDYRRHKGGRWWNEIHRDPSTLFPRHSWLYNRYADWRRYKCKRWGR